MFPTTKPAESLTPAPSRKGVIATIVAIWTPILATLATVVVG